MNKRYALMIAAGLLINFGALHADKEIFDQTMPLGVWDEKIQHIEASIVKLALLHKKAQNSDNQESIARIENRLKQLFKERAGYIKNLEKKGFTPVVNKALFTNIEWRLKEAKQDSN